MGRRKYLSDYRLPEPGESPDARAAYTGVYFVFPDPAMPRSAGWNDFIKDLLLRTTNKL